MTSPSLEGTSAVSLTCSVVSLFLMAAVMKSMIGSCSSVRYTTTLIVSLVTP